MTLHRFSFPTLIIFGAGARRELPAFLASRSIRRPLLVTDREVARLPITRELEGILVAGGLKTSVFSELQGNPVKSQVEAGVLACGRLEADAVIGLGGGAALDVAKAIALMAGHPGDLFDYATGARQVEGAVLPWISVPTTSGTGSEVGRSTVISDERTHVKQMIFSPRLLAAAVFADPELTIGLPSGPTAATGMDALSHCVESYLSKSYHPICDGIALEGLRLIAGNLERAVREPGNLEARGSMMMASIMGGIAFQKDLGLTHSCAHALGTVMDMHHGLANGIMINHALAFNLPVAPRRFQDMAMTIGLQAEAATGPGAAFLRWLEGLKARIGIPARLSEAGVRPEHLERLVEIAVRDGCHQYNPRPVTREDFREIFQKAL